MSNAIRIMEEVNIYMNYVVKGASFEQLNLLLSWNFIVYYFIITLKLQILFDFNRIIKTLA